MAVGFQVLDPLEFLAEFTQYIPPKGSHLIRYYGWYSNKARGMRRKAAEAEAAELPGAIASSEASEVATPSRSSQTKAMLIKRVYEIDPLCCPKRQGEMKVIAFIKPPQADVIEKILRHCGLWHSSRAPPAISSTTDTARRPPASHASGRSSPRAQSGARRKVSSTPTPSPATRPTSGIAGRPTMSPGSFRSAR
ncbi:MAG: transposase [Planctomycetota bacterium]|nr:transposase [Planctomycetota bacterium]